MGVREFNGVFNRNNVAFGFLVPVVNQRGHGRRLTGPGTANKQNQAQLGHDELWQNRRQAEFLVVRQGVTQSPDHHGVFITLFENVDAEPAKTLTGNSEVTFRIVLKGVSLLFSHHAVGDHGDFTWQHGNIGDLVQGAVKLGGRGCAGTVVKV